MCSNVHSADGSSGGSACRTERAVFERRITSPGLTSRIASQPIVRSAQDSDAAAWPPLFRRPTESGRKPHGSRTANTPSRVRITSEYAPRHLGIVARIRSSQVAPSAPASISVITSLSLEESRPTPFCSSSRRRA